MHNDLEDDFGRGATLALVTDANATEIMRLAEIARELICGCGNPLADLNAAAQKALPLAAVIPIASIARVFAQAMRGRDSGDYANAIRYALGIGPDSDEAIFRLECDIARLQVEHQHAEAEHKAHCDAHKARAARISIEMTRNALALSWIADRNHRLSLAQILYWHPPRIAPAWAIAAGLILNRLPLDCAAQAKIKQEHAGLTSAALKMIGHGFMVSCLTRGCDGVHVVRSRRELVGYREIMLEVGEWCPKCAAAVRERLRRTPIRNDC